MEVGVKGSNDRDVELVRNALGGPSEWSFSCDMNEVRSRSCPYALDLAVGGQPEAKAGIARKRKSLGPSPSQSGVVLRIRRDRSVQGRSLGVYVRGQSDPQLVGEESSPHR